MKVAISHYSKNRQFQQSSLVESSPRTTRMRFDRPAVLETKTHCLSFETVPRAKDDEQEEPFISTPTTQSSSGSHVTMKVPLPSGKQRTPSTSLAGSSSHGSSSKSNNSSSLYTTPTPRRGRSLIFRTTPSKKSSTPIPPRSQSQKSTPIPPRSQSQKPSPRRGRSETSSSSRRRFSLSRRRSSSRFWRGLGGKNATDNDKGAPTLADTLITESATPTGTELYPSSEPVKVEVQPQPLVADDKDDFAALPAEEEAEEAGVEVDREQYYDGCCDDDDDDDDEQRDQFDQVFTSSSSQLFQVDYSSRCFPSDVSCVEVYLDDDHEDEPKQEEEETVPIRSRSSSSFFFQRQQEQQQQQQHVREEVPEEIVEPIRTRTSSSFFFQQRQKAKEQLQQQEAEEEDEALLIMLEQSQAKQAAADQMLMAAPPAPVAIIDSSSRVVSDLVSELSGPSPTKKKQKKKRPQRKEDKPHYLNEQSVIQVKRALSRLHKQGDSLTSKKIIRTLLDVTDTLESEKDRELIRRQLSQLSSFSDEEEDDESILHASPPRRVDDSLDEESYVPVGFCQLPGGRVVVDDDDECSETSSFVDWLRHEENKSSHWNVFSGMFWHDDKEEDDHEEERYIVEEKSMQLSTPPKIQRQLSSNKTFQPRSVSHMEYQSLQKGEEPREERILAQGKQLLERRQRTAERLEKEHGRKVVTVVKRTGSKNKQPGMVFVSSTADEQHPTSSLSVPSDEMSHERYRSFIKTRDLSRSQQRQRARSKVLEESPDLVPIAVVDVTKQRRRSIKSTTTADDLRRRTKREMRDSVVNQQYRKKVDP